MLDGEWSVRFLFSAVAIYLSTSHGAFVLVTQSRKHGKKATSLSSQMKHDSLCVDWPAVKIKEKYFVIVTWTYY
jgi:hypothetical protein